MRKKIFWAVLLSLALVWAASAEPVPLTGDFKAETPALKLVKALVTTLTPESLLVVFGGEPQADGTIPEVYVEARGISAGTAYRLDTAVLSGKMVRLAPVSGWDATDIRSLRPEKWEGIFNIEVVLKEDDLRKAIPIALARNKKAADKWGGLDVDFRPGQIHVKGKYDVNSGMKAAFKITTGLEIRGGKQLWLVNTKVQINNAEQTDAIRKELKKRNPPADLGQLEVPLVLRTVTLTDTELRLRSATAPKPFPGTAYRYSK